MDQPNLEEKIGLGSLDQRKNSLYFLTRDSCGREAAFLRVQNVYVYGVEPRERFLL